MAGDLTAANCPLTSLLELWHSWAHPPHTHTKEISDYNENSFQKSTGLAASLLLSLSSARGLPKGADHVLATSYNPKSRIYKEHSRKTCAFLFLPKLLFLWKKYIILRALIHKKLYLIKRIQLLKH